MELKHEIIRVEKARFETFFDALLAIVMTIMILEVKIPDGENLSDPEIKNQLTRSIGPLIGFLISFFTLISIWFDHHDLMKNAKEITKRFAFLNLIFIAIIAFLPFTTSLAWENPNSSFSVLIYSVNIFCINLLLTALFIYAGLFNFYPKHFADSQYGKVKKITGISGVVLLLAAMIISFYFPIISLAITAAIPAIHLILLLLANNFKS